MKAYLCRPIITRKKEIYYHKKFFSQEKIRDLLMTETESKSIVNSIMQQPILYGDFAKALDEGEPRIYDNLLKYDVVKALFVEVSPISYFL